MATSGPLPTRTVRVETEDPDELAGAQPERKRRVDQLGPGRFRAELVEAAWGAAALQTERWSCGLRVRSDRPPGYVTFALIEAAGGARWCGIELASGDLLRREKPWELTSSGPLETVAFAVDAGRLRDVQHPLAGGEWRSAAAGNFRGRSPEWERLKEGLQRLLGTVRSASAEPAALAAAEADLLHLAAARRARRPPAVATWCRLRRPCRPPVASPIRERDDHGWDEDFAHRLRAGDEAGLAPPAAPPSEGRPPSQGLRPSRSLLNRGAAEASPGPGARP